MIFIIQSCIFSSFGDLAEVNIQSSLIFRGACNTTNKSLESARGRRPLFSKSLLWSKWLYHLKCGLCAKLCYIGPSASQAHTMPCRDPATSTTRQSNILLVQQMAKHTLPVVPSKPDPSFTSLTSPKPVSPFLTLHIT